MDLDFLSSHPFDIASFALERRGVALVFVTGVEGGSVRAPGLRMAIAADGASVGYVSNGCVEADLVRTAQEAIAAGTVVATSYGRGSGKIDIVLPCGGRVDLLVVPVGAAHQPALRALAAGARASGVLGLDADGTLRWQVNPRPELGADWSFAVHPRIRLLVIGAGSEALLLARLAAMSDMEVEVHSPDPLTLRRAGAMGLAASGMAGLSAQLGLAADGLTAVALMFHDHEWERRVLAEVLAGPAFYVGALGSRRAHAARVAMLEEAGCDAGAIARIRAPIGLVHRLRDPNLLAAAVIAEIAGEFQKRYTAF